MKESLELQEKTPRGGLSSLGLQTRLTLFYLGQKYRPWLAFPWLLLLAVALLSQFYLGYRYNSNDTTNIYLQLARGCSYTLLLVLCLLWLPVMRHGLAALWRSRWASWLPLEQAKNVHRWLGHLMMAGAMVHGACYLLYFNTLDAPFMDVLFGTESDVVRSMRTTMYEFVSEDESIDDVIDWIDQGRPEQMFHDVIRPIMKEDCTKCHSASSTMTYAIPSLPLSYFDDVVALSQRGIYSRQFRINVCGLLMLLMLLPLWFTSLAVMRRRQHHVFQNIHRLGYLMVVLALLHIPRYNWLLVPAIILALEYFLSHYVRIYRGCHARMVRVSEGMLRLEMQRPDGFVIEPGHYLQLRVPKLGRYEWHDFSLTGGREGDDVIVLKIKAQGDWSDALYDQLGNDGRAELDVDIRGPFASPAARPTRRREPILMVAGGIGITPFLGLLYTMLFDSVKRRPFHLVWVLRDGKLLEWLEPFLSSPLIAGGRIHLFLTQDEGADALPAWLQQQDVHGDRVVFYQHRPDLERLFSDVSEELERPHCFVCGPEEMTRAVAAQCRKRGWVMSIERF
ncbi:NAD(P)H-flavin reductase [Sinobacterium caligoides]|uniref:NAD(P)H-flavin reductase n=1 Tax=Sinobacterium caligoides TaxID=933926 RepID=A0A3N2E0B2_9GAMM|nr:NADPH oxidase family protein [Sinobacterium caligoides]ROS05457.1 NAD(P)H-flavin reductase [Sinobacterium caligoides]